MQHHRSGFTLIEVAVVLAIIGLIIGGVLLGRNVLHNAELLKVGTDGTVYRDAMTKFREQYGWLPGDFPNATQMWGRADGNGDIFSNCAQPNVTESVGLLTCNGDGDGIISDGTHEKFRAWQHLAAGKYLSGNFSGVSAYAGAGNYNGAKLNYNIPSGALTQSGFMFDSRGNRNETAAYFAGNYDNIIFIGKARNVGSDVPNSDLLLPKEAYSIDNKLDDGFPGLGTIVSNRGAWGGSRSCVSVSGANAPYPRDSSEAGCLLIFKEKKPQ